MLSAAQASFAVRWETMDTMVCSIFSGAKSDVWASMDRLRAPDNLEMGANICSLSDGAILAVDAVVAGSTVEGWKAVAILETGLVAVVGPGETMAGDDVSAVTGPRKGPLPCSVRGISVRKVSQVSEAEPGFREIGDAS